MPIPGNVLNPPPASVSGTPVKVVIFCGGLGVRMGEETQRIPKPMIPIGNRPILWHIMSWYAAWGHRDFILCLGYKAEVIKEYFLQYNEMLFNDFVLESDGESTHVELLSRDVGGLEDHVRRHGRELDDRRAPEGGRALSRRRRGVPRHVRRRAHRRPARRPDRGIPPGGEAGDAPVRAPGVPRAHRAVGRVGRGRRRRGDEPVVGADQRRLLRVQARSGRPDRARGGSRGRGVRAPDRAGASCTHTPTTASSARWTRSRTGSGSRRCTSRAGRPGGCRCRALPPAPREG